jgi:hypothetical protein
VSRLVLPVLIAVTLLYPFAGYGRWGTGMGTTEQVTVDKTNGTVGSAWGQYGAVQYGSDAFLNRHLPANLTGVKLMGGGASARTEWNNERFLDVELAFHGHRARVAAGTPKGPQFLVLDGQYGLPLWLKKVDESRQRIGSSVKDYLGVTFLPSALPSAYGVWLVPGFRIISDFSLHLHAAAMLGVRVGKTRHAIGVNPHSGKVRRTYQQAWWFQLDALFYGPAWGPGVEAELALSYTLEGYYYGGYFALVSQYFPAFASPDEYTGQTDLAQSWASLYLGLRFGLQFYVPH